MNGKQINEECAQGTWGPGRSTMEKKIKRAGSHGIPQGFRHRDS